MEQAQFRVSLSVGTKLLMSLVLLLVGVILVINLTAIYVLTNDKRESVYQQQATDTFVIGKDFVGKAQRDLDALRLVLANLDPTKPEQWPNKKPALQNIIDNQSDIFLIQMRKLDPKTKAFDALFEIKRDDLLDAYELKSDTVKVSNDMAMQIFDNLERDGFAFVNGTGAGQIPILAIVVADLKTPLAGGGFLVATAFVSLKSLHVANQTELTIADTSGWILYDSDPAIQQQRLNIVNDPQFSKSIENTVNSGTLEFSNDEGRFLGSFYKPGFNLAVLAKTPWNHAMRALYALIEQFILIGIIALGFAVIFALLYSRTMTAPLNILYDATKEIAMGNFALDLNVKGRDEISALGHSFNLMSRQISGLIEEKIKKAHLENEIAIASTVQQTLIPPVEIDNPYVKIRSMYRAADVCGGDWWGYFAVGSHSCFAIADATGHGLPSALITAAIRSCFSVIEKRFQDNPGDNFSPSELLAYANRSIYEAAKGQIMMTLFLAVLDHETGILTFSSAGHNPPWLFKKNEDGTFARNSLVAKGIRLGEGYEVPKYDEKNIKVDIGDILFLFTDGVIEGTNLSNEQYSKRMTLLKVGQSVPSGPQEVISVLSGEIDTHNQGKSLDDDITLAAIEFQKVGE